MSDAPIIIDFKRPNRGLELMVGVENDRVIVKFPKAVKEMNMSADEALAVANILVKNAMTAKVVKPESPKKEG